MRDREYRRKAEKKHYKKRLNNAIHNGLFIYERNEDGSLSIVAGNNKKPYLHLKDAATTNPDKDYTFGPKKAEVRKKNWVHLLKNGNVLKTKWLDSYNKRDCRRTRRHFQKLVDYKLPDHVWYDRCQVIYPREIV